MLSDILVSLTRSTRLSSFVSLSPELNDTLCETQSSKSTPNGGHLEKFMRIKEGEKKEKKESNERLIEKKVTMTEMSK